MVESIEVMLVIEELWSWKSELWHEFDCELVAAKWKLMEVEECCSWSLKKRRVENDAENYQSQEMQWMLCSGTVAQRM